jgi:pantoate--beta-alanine ligase
MNVTARTKHRLIATADEARRLAWEARRSDLTVGVVMTMGALHEGHLSLVKASNETCDRTVVTVFVNPTQFGPSEDFHRYPRQLSDDVAALDAYDVEFIFAPTVDEMYPPGHSTFVEPPSVARPLEGQCRPGHFRGVTTVVLKLLNVIPADIAFFGQKDYQQYLVIRQTVADLNIPVEVQVCPTVRDADGLALSSRNQYLTDEQRECALAIPRSLQLARQLVEQNERNAGRIAARMRQVLAAGGVTHIDYVALADPETLEEAKRIERPVLVAVAAHVGSTRLIDNLLIAPSG